MTRKKDIEIPYPNVICSDCAEKAGKTWPKDHIATFYEATCDMCKKTKTCTEPRDWGGFSAEELRKIVEACALSEREKDT